MELKDLVGPHDMLIAARTDITHPMRSDAEGIAFYLDETMYIVFEDDNDGYRSSAGPIFSSKCAPYALWSPDYIRRKVVVRHVTTSSYDGDGADIIEAIDVENGHVWLRVGTENIDDYYPSFVATWTPMP